MCRILTLPKLLYDWMLSECMMMYMYESFICLTWHVSIGIICLYCYLYSSKGTVLSTYFKKFTLHIDFTLHHFYLCVSSPFQPKLVDRFFYEVFLYVTCHIVVSISCSLLLYIVFCVTINLLSLFFLISDQYLGSIQQLPQL